MIPSDPVKRGRGTRARKRRGTERGRLRNGCRGTPMLSESENFCIIPSLNPNIALHHFCGSSRGSMRPYKYFCRRKPAIVFRKVAEGLRCDCGQSQHGSIRFLRGLRGIFAVSCGRRTAENRGLNTTSGKVYLVIYSIHVTQKNF